MVSQRHDVLLGNINGKDNNQIIEIVVKEDEHIFEIRLLGYGEGLGWYVQKTIPIDIHEADACIKILSKIHNTSEKELIRYEDVVMDGKVVQFSPRFPLEIVREDVDEK